MNSTATYLWNSLCSLHFGCFRRLHNRHHLKVIVLLFETHGFSFCREVLYNNDLVVDISEGGEILRGLLVLRCKIILKTSRLCRKYLVESLTSLSLSPFSSCLSTPRRASLSTSPLFHSFPSTTKISFEARSVCCLLQLVPEIKMGEAD